jgi:hypothetical protein
MHQLFLEKHPEAVVSFDFYFRYFKSDFNFRFGHPRSDTCQTCDNIAKGLSSQNISDKKHKTLEVNK